MNSAYEMLLAKLKARNSTTPPGNGNSETLSSLPPGNDKPGHQIINAYGQLITLNSAQSEFVSLVTSGKSCVLLGPAGTGKTTCTQAALQSRISAGIPTLQDTLGHKYLTQHSPGIVCTSFTRRAVRNLKRALSEDLKPTAITIHKLLEYAPQYYEVLDPETQEYKTTMRFEPTRNEHNPLPRQIKVCVIDEASMVSTELFSQLQDALPADCQFIFIGDLHQLPPVFGSAILGFKGLELPVVQLTEVYRQALESPIISLATRIRNAESIEVFTEKTTQEHPTQGKVTIHPWKKKLHPDSALLTAAKFFTTAIDQGLYDPSEDCILTPFNKACGTIELNKHIAQHLARKHGREVYEVIAGFNKHYFSVGDLVLCDKEDAEIISITRNGTYLGKRPVPHSLTLDYWGYDSQAASHQVEVDTLEDVELFLAAAAGGSEERVTVASHLITVRMIDSGEEVTLDSAAEVNSLILSYALTVHKSQGSEWERVFILFHQSHNTMLNRELTYTAVTRAKKELYIICEPDSLQKASRNAKIKGDTLAEKLEYFKGKQATLQLGEQE